MRDNAKQSISLRRTKLMFWLVIAIWMVFAGRLFYLQIVKGDYYRNLAVESQEKKYEIDAKRGAIYAMDRDQIRPLVLNENLPTVFADPRYIEDKVETAMAIDAILGGGAAKYQQLLDDDSAYVVIRPKTPLELADKIDQAEIKGVGTQDHYYRVYPENAVAAQILGFVNADGDGQYGVEEYFNKLLGGTPGRVEAITDVNGVPLRGDKRNILSDPRDGEAIVLTIDANLQKRAEEALAEAVKKGQAKGGGVLVIDPNNGQIKAMANYPTFNPAAYGEVADFSVFNNGIVSYAYENGSVIKPLTMATGLNEGAVTPETTYYDAGYVVVDDWRIENAAVPSGYTRSMRQVIQYSINTGVVFVLERLGGGEINLQSRQSFYDYFTNRFGFGSLLGIEQPNENSGIIADPETGDGLDIRYANMTFGQGMTATMLQTASALSSVLNGGTYYKPTIIKTLDYQGVSEEQTTPLILRDNVVSSETGRNIREMMRLVVEQGSSSVARRQGYRIGGKTGLAQIALPDGTYSQNREIGSFIGYIEGGEGLEYVIMTRVDEPIGYRYAGSGAAAPLFADVANWLIDFEKIPPVD